jgi:integrase
MRSSTTRPPAGTFLRRWTASFGNSNKFGDCPVKLLDDRRVRGEFLAWRDEIAKSSPRQADYIITVFARALSWALDRGMISVNLLERPGRVWSRSRAEKVWSNADEQKFLEVASPQMALALMLGLWTGQRQGDLLRLTWKAYDGQFIRLRQSKTDVHVTVPVGKPLRQFWTRRPAYHRLSSPPRIIDPTHRTVFALRGAKLVTEPVLRASPSTTFAAPLFHDWPVQVRRRWRLLPSPATSDRSWTNAILAAIRQWPSRQCRSPKREQSLQTVVQTVLSDATQKRSLVKNQSHFN